MGFLTSTNTGPQPVGGAIMSGVNALGSLSNMTGLPQWVQSKVGTPGTTPMLPPHPAGIDMEALAAKSAADQLARKRKAQ